MATLHPADLPLLDPPLSGRSPVPAGEEVDRGPHWIDRETVELVASRVMAGLVVIHPDAEAGLAKATDIEVADTFARFLSSSPLGSRYTIEHRAYALLATLTELAIVREKGTAQNGPDHPGALVTQWASTQLEMRLVDLRGKVASLLQLDTIDPLVETVCSKVAMLDTRTLAELTGISEGSFVAWRKARRNGPPWIEVAMPSGSRLKVFYPIAGVLAWLYGGA